MIKLSLQMLKRQCSTERAINNKRQFYQQDFYIHHPLLERIIESKLEKCLKYGQVREFIIGSKKVLTKKTNLHVIEAPFVVGSPKKIQFKMRQRSSSGFKTGFSRPKTTNTIIRSRTSEPRIRQKLEYLVKQQEHQESLRPTLNIRRIIDAKN